jgi:hypothetical protein
MLGDRILLSDFDERQKRARLVIVEIATGDQQVIVLEPAEFPILRPR